MSLEIVYKMMYEKVEADTDLMAITRLENEWTIDGARPYIFIELVEMTELTLETQALRLDVNTYTNQHTSIRAFKIADLLKKLLSNTQTAKVIDGYNYNVGLTTSTRTIIPADELGYRLRLTAQGFLTITNPSAVIPVQPPGQQSPRQFQQGSFKPTRVDPRQFSAEHGVRQGDDDEIVPLTPRQKQLQKEHREWEERKANNGVS